jgi:hypothetical protein
MLVEDMSRNKYFFQVRISYVLRFTSIYDLFTDSSSYDSKYRRAQKLYTHSNVQNICLYNLLVYLRFYFENARMQPLQYTLVEVMYGHF